MIIEETAAEPDNCIYTQNDHESSGFVCAAHVMGHCVLRGIIGWINHLM